ncbi:hypothetical protein A2U01_0057546 [Trifolium medium]|uniref:Uncharacterized protein n=1 Tax=Trifolium medium TaxID=97028 RepID=A0A392RIA5_9FABA|nr:hypothetical protein [Trifolium medium]
MEEGIDGFFTGSVEKVIYSPVEGSVEEEFHSSEGLGTCSSYYDHLVAGTLIYRLCIPFSVEEIEGNHACSSKLE